MRWIFLTILPFFLVQYNFTLYLNYFIIFIILFKLSIEKLVLFFLHIIEKIRGTTLNTNTHSISNLVSP